MAELNFYEWAQEVNKSIRKRTLKAGRNISLEEHDDKTIIHSDFDGGGGGGSASYNGPFNAEKVNDNSVLVWGYNTAAGRFFRAYVILGLSLIEMAEATITGITVSGYIYLEISFNVSYSVEAKFASSLPAQSNTRIYHPIAFITATDSKISEIIQLQHGIVHFAGRAL